MLDDSKSFVGAKQLPRNEAGNISGFFNANGTDYIIRTPEECLTIERWTTYENLSLMYGFDRTLQSIYNTIKDTKDDLNDILRGNNSKNVVEVIQKQQSLLDGMAKRTDAKYGVALYICSLFIVTENEDITKWDYNSAKKKIDDWSAEGLSIADFFSLAMTMQADFKRVLQSHLGIR